MSHKREKELSARNEFTASASAPTLDTEKFLFAGFSSPNYTQVPDEFFDVLAPQLSEAELRVALYILRRTFGFKKGADTISLKQLIEGIKTHDGQVLDRGTGLSRPGAVKGVKGLIEKGVIIASRNMAADGGNLPTTYALRFAPAEARIRPQNRAGGELTSLTPGGKPRFDGGVNVVNPQETDLQETVLQETEDRTNSNPKSALDIHHSNIRNARAQKIEEAGVGNSTGPGVQETLVLREPSLASAAKSLDGTPEARGFTTAARVARERYASPAGSSRHTKERVAIQAYIHDYSLKFNDRAGVKSSTTRALHLFEQSGLELPVFLGLLVEAQSITQERTEHIKNGGLDKRGSWTPKNKMPYYFAVLEDLLGLREHLEVEPAASHAQTVKQTEIRSSGGRGTPRRRRPAIGGPYVPVVAQPIEEDTGDDDTDTPSVPSEGLQRGVSPSAGLPLPSDRNGP